MRQQLLNTIQSIRFRQWSRKNYAVFAGLHKVISIGKVNASISDKAILKTNSLSVNSSILSDNSLNFKDEDEEKETLFFENFIQANTLNVATDIPVGRLAQYLLFIHSKLE